MPLRCPECRSRRATFVSLIAHVATSGHALCRCGGYHYPHRPGSRYCDRNPMAPAWRASREGVEGEALLEVAVECAWNTEGRRGGQEAPF